MNCCVFFQDVEIKEEGTKHMLILYNVRMDMAGGVDFSAANAKSNAQLRVKCESTFSAVFIHLFICQSCFGALTVVPRTAKYSLSFSFSFPLCPFKLFILENSSF